MTADRVRRGREGERWAAMALQLAGYRLLERRWRIHGGEVDLIAEDRDGYVFVEVKARGGAGFGPPELAVGPKKLRTIQRAATRWLLERVGDRPVDWRIDVVAIEMGRDWRPHRITIHQYFEL